MYDFMLDKIHSQFLTKMIGETSNKRKFQESCIIPKILSQGWRQKNSDRGADASDEGANYFGTRALKPDRS